ncbi:cytochrome c [Roseibacterium sp. SDUM158017]|uniref:c-type cytochrome n=1 Tax=Roseicyclus salinarum TaxID=3036773 RepID=UPI002414EAEB|nr:cytochrome c [Roseibacterium sp. SDUM158017]MDG4647597.1 cytochrome c [Roseibacterium sp. SDUM158017]
MRHLIAAVAMAAALPAAAQDAARGERLFAEHCAVCHGLGLRGDGPMAEILLIPPPDLTRIAERHDGFPRVGIARTIDGRAPMVSHGSDMPIYGYVFREMSRVLHDGSQTVVTAPEVVDLVAYLESVQE